MRKSTETGTVLQQWLVRKHETIKAVQKTHNNNKISAKHTATNKKLD